MTQDEVELIYDYLHENYEYRDGELIRLKDCQRSGKKSGAAIGSFFYRSKNPSMRCGISMNGKKIYKPLSHLVFLYHNNRFPEYLYFDDKNPTNCRIENIIECTNSQIQNKKHVGKGYEEIKTTNGVRFRVSITTKKNNIRGKIHLGSYKNKEQAQDIYRLAKDMYISGMSENEIKSNLLSKYPDLQIKTYKNKNNLAGVHKSGIRFKSSICINSKINYLGTFDTPEEAHEAYLKAKKELTNK